MGFNIVTVNVSQTIGAIPSNLQQMSAVLSFGSTTHEPGSLYYSPAIRILTIWLKIRLLRCRRLPQENLRQTSPLR